MGEVGVMRECAQPFGDMAWRADLDLMHCGHWPSRQEGGAV